MIESMPIHDAVIGEMIRGRGCVDHVGPRGIIHLELVRAGKVIHVQDINNAVVNAAKNDLLGVYFDAGSHSSNWSIGLIDNGTFSTTSLGDTISSHSGWTEYTNYTVGSGNTMQRAAWGQGSPSGQQITNASPAIFTFTTAIGALWGILVVADATKGGTGGILWSTAAFNATLNVQIGDVLNVTYTVQL